MTRKTTLIGRYYVKQEGRECIYDNEKLKSLIEQGLKDQDVADQVGCSKQRVAHARRAMGIFYRFGSGGLPKYDHRKMRELHDQGKNDCEIAAELGCLPNTVSVWRTKQGLPVIGRHKKQNISS